MMPINSHDAFLRSRTLTSLCFVHCITIAARIARIAKKDIHTKGYIKSLLNIAIRCILYQFHFSCNVKGHFLKCNLQIQKFAHFCPT